MTRGDNEMTIKHYVEFFYPGSFVGETSAHEVVERDAEVAPLRGAYGHRFFSRSEVDVGGEILRGDRRDVSPMTYYGEELTLADVEALPGDYSILLSNMRCNGYDRVVRTVRGNFQPLFPGDVVAPATKESQS